MKDAEVRKEKGQLTINIYENDEIQDWLHIEEDEISLVRDACNKFLEQKKPIEEVEKSCSNIPNYQRWVNCGNNNDCNSRLCDVCEKWKPKTCNNCEHRYTMNQSPCFDCRNQSKWEAEVQRNYDISELEQQEDKHKDCECVNHIWKYSQLLIDPPINKRTCAKCNQVEFYKNGRYVTADVELQEDKPKKLKLRITQKKAKRLQEILCRGCTDTTACGMCIACLDRYIKKEV